MKLSESEHRYTVKEKPTDAIDPVWVLYEVEEWDSGGLSKRFFARLTHTQATRKNVQQGITQWCENNPQKLPRDGETIPSLDLDNLERRVDRR